MPVSIHRIVLLLAFIIIVVACKKKKQEEPPFIRSKENPIVMLDTITQSGFNSFNVSGVINQPWWLLNLHPERGIIYSTEPDPSLDNSTRIKLTSTNVEDFLKVQHDLDELPDGKNIYIRLYIKADTNRVWYSRVMMVSTKTFTLRVSTDKKVGRGMRTAISIWPGISELPLNKMEIYLGAYKAEGEIKYAEGALYFQVPDNIPPGKYPVIGKLLNLKVEAADSIQVLAGKWTMLASPPFKGRGRMAHFVWNNKGFIVGGTPAAREAAIYREVWQFDFATRTWTRKKDFPIELLDAVAFNVNNRIFVMGGATGPLAPNTLKRLQPDIWEYDPNGDTWTNRGPHPQQKTARSLMAGTVLNNRIYVGTGSSYLHWYVRDVFSDWMMFDPATNTWTDLAPVTPSGLRGGACFNDGENIYMVGGDNTNYLIHEKDVKRYNVRTNTWDFLPRIPNNRFRTQASVIYIHNVPYIYGGVRSTAGGNEVERNTIDLWRFNTASPHWTEFLFYNSDQGIVVLPPGSPDMIFPGAQPAVFPTANGFILYGGSYQFDGDGHSHSLVEYTLE